MRPESQFAWQAQPRVDLRIAAEIRRPSSRLSAHSETRRREDARAATDAGPGIDVQLGRLLLLHAVGGSDPRPLTGSGWFTATSHALDSEWVLGPPCCGDRG